jgi:hypothetical protein
MLAAGILLVVLGASPGSAADTTAESQKKAYALYQDKCLGCHDSVADPERTGRTRDDWLLVVTVMHDYGLDISPQEQGMIVDLLYAIRKGMERQPG